MVLPFAGAPEPPIAVPTMKQVDADGSIGAATAIERTQVSVRLDVRLTLMPAEASLLKLASPSQRAFILAEVIAKALDGQDGYSAHCVITND